MIEFTIKTLDSMNHQFSVEDETTVGQLKHRIRAEMGIEIRMQRLIFCGRVLTDDRRLAEFDVNGKVIHLVPRPPPSPTSRNSSHNPRQEMREAMEEAQRVIDRMSHQPTLRQTPMQHIWTLDPPSELVFDQQQEAMMTPMSNRLELIRRILDDIRNSLNALFTHMANENSGEAAAPPAEPMDTESSPPPDTFPNETPPTESSSTKNDATERTSTEMSSARREGDAVADDHSMNSETRLPRRRSGQRPLRPPLTRPRDLAQLVDELDQLHAEFAPFRGNYLNILREGTSEQLPESVRAHRQKIIEMVCDVMHSFAHAYHAVSDINVSVGERYPRLSEGFSGVHQYQHQHNVPLQAHINVVHTARPVDESMFGARVPGNRAATSANASRPSNTGQGGTTPLVAAFRAQRAAAAAAAAGSAGARPAPAASGASGRAGARGDRQNQGQNTTDFENLLRALSQAHPGVEVVMSMEEIHSVDNPTGLSPPDNGPAEFSAAIYGTVDNNASQGDNGPNPTTAPQSAAGTGYGPVTGSNATPDAASNAGANTKPNAAADARPNAGAGAGPNNRRGPSHGVMTWDNAPTGFGTGSTIHFGTNFESDSGSDKESNASPTTGGGAQPAAGNGLEPGAGPTAGPGAGPTAGPGVGPGLRPTTRPDVRPGAGPGVWSATYPTPLTNLPPPTSYEGLVEAPPRPPVADVIRIGPPPPGTSFPPGFGGIPGFGTTFGPIGPGGAPTFTPGVGVTAFGPASVTLQPDGGVYLAPIPTSNIGPGMPGDMLQNMLSSMIRHSMNPAATNTGSSTAATNPTATTTAASTGATTTTTATTTATTTVTTTVTAQPTYTWIPRTPAYSWSTSVPYNPWDHSPPTNAGGPTTTGPTNARATTAPTTSPTTTAPTNARNTTAPTNAPTTAVPTNVRTTTAPTNARPTTAPPNPWADGVPTNAWGPVIVQTTGAPPNTANNAATTNTATYSTQSFRIPFNAVPSFTPAATFSSYNTFNINPHENAEGRTSDNIWGISPGQDFPNVLHLENISMSPGPGQERLGPLTAMARARTMQQAEQRRRAEERINNPHVYNSISDRNRQRTSNARSHHLAMAGMVYDRFLSCDSLHARRRLTERRTVYQELHTQQLRQRRARPTAPDIDVLEQRNLRFSTRHMAVMMRLLSGPNFLAGQYNAFLVTVARVLFLEPEGRPRAYDHLCMPREFIFVRRQMREYIQDVLGLVVSSDAGRNRFDTVAGIIINRNQDFLDRMGDYTPLDLPSNPGLLLRTWLRQRVPALVACVLSDSSTDLFVVRFYEVFVRFYTDLCAFFYRFCSDGYNGFNVLYTAYIEDATASFEEDSRVWLRVLARENLHAIRSTLDPSAPTSFFLRYDPLSRSQVRQTMPLTTPPPAARGDTPDTIESPPSMSIPSMSSSSEDSESPQPPEGDEESSPPLEEDNESSGADTVSTTSHNSIPRSPVQMRSAATSPRHDTPPVPEAQNDQNGVNAQNGQSAQAGATSPVRARSQETTAPTSPESMQFVPPVVILEHWGEEWVPVFTRDQRAQRERDRNQEPYSDAYLSGMPSRKRRCLRAARPPTTLDGFMNESVREATDRSASLDPTHIRSVLRDSVRSLVRTRAETSEDYDPARFSSTARFLDQTKHNKTESEPKTD